MCVLHVVAIDELESDAVLALEVWRGMACLAFGVLGWMNR
jgi:hypothetical protein